MLAQSMYTAACFVYLLVLTNELFSFNTFQPFFIQDNPYMTQTMTLTPESNHDISSPGSNEMNTTFSPGLNNPNQGNSPNNVYESAIPQPRFSEMGQSATTTF